MLSGWADITIPVLAVLTLVLLAGPLALELNDESAMQLGFVGEGINPRDLQHMYENMIVDII